MAIYPVLSLCGDDPRKAAVEAAIARTKARKRERNILLYGPAQRP
ncbi:hypothetical protein ACLKT3_003176 [Salmonella enterica subsp. enterica serovar 50:k:e,n,x,z15]